MSRFAWPFIGVASVALFVLILFLGLTGCALMPDTIAFDAVLGDSQSDGEAK